jgi:hypothetical protein
MFTDRADPLFHPNLLFYAFQYAVSGSWGFMARGPRRPRGVGAAGQGQRHPPFNSSFAADCVALRKRWGIRRPRRHGGAAQTAGLCVVGVGIAVGGSALALFEPARPSFCGSGRSSLLSPCAAYRSRASSGRASEECRTAQSRLGGRRPTTHP